MKTGIMTGVLFLLSFTSYAQVYHPITHTSGTRWVEGNIITVSPIDKPSTGGGLCGVDDYWIGFRENSGYKFIFGNPVFKLRIRMTVINRTDIIELLVDDKPFPIANDWVGKYPGQCEQASVALVEGHLIKSNVDFSNVEINIPFSRAPSSISLKQQNGSAKGAGVVFDIAVVNEAQLELIDDQTGITDATHSEVFTIWPNPSTDQVQVLFLPKTAGIGNLTIIDIHGRSVYSANIECSDGNLKKQPIDILHFVPGSYIVELTLNDQTYRRKLIKL